MNPFEYVCNTTHTHTHTLFTFPVLNDDSKSTSLTLACFLIIKYVSIQFTVSSQAAGQNERKNAKIIYDAIEFMAIGFLCHNRTKN